MLSTARSYAMAAHGEQKYGDKPYAFHLDAVASLLTPYGECAQAIGYLHDVIEDTATTYAEIQERFGEFVATCVALLTDEPGPNRKERKAKTYAKLAQVQGPSELALIVKAADRLANVRACVVDRKRDLWEMYRSEQLAFKKAAYRIGLCEPLWAELDILLTDSGFDTPI